MIAHAFPPAGGSGPNRALAFARYLSAFGWRPVVVTPGVEYAAARDDAALALVPRWIDVLRTRSFEAQQRTGSARSGGASAKPSRIRQHLGHLKRFPDAHVGWLPFALAAAVRTDFDVLYSSSGPFTAHLIGLVMKRCTGRPWVAELRDGWYLWNRSIFPDYPVWRGALEQRIESAVIRSADRVVLVTDRMRDAFRCQYPDLPTTHFAVVPNGFDPAQVALRGDGRARNPDRFEILHAGALYYGRSIQPLLEATQRVSEALPGFKEAFKLTLIGTLDALARAELEHTDLPVELLGQMDHGATLQRIAQADALLLVANTTAGAEATVPGKLFEYLALNRPVLALAAQQSATADVLRATGGGVLAPSDDIGAIAQALTRLYAQRGGDTDQATTRQYDRRLLTRDLARLFDEVSGAARRL